MFYKVNIQGGTTFTSSDVMPACTRSFRCVTIELRKSSWRCASFHFCSFLSKI